jgi:hypothetical protein
MPWRLPYVAEGSCAISGVQRGVQRKDRIMIIDYQLWHRSCGNYDGTAG